MATGLHPLWHRLGFEAVRAVAEAIGDGDDSAYHGAWVAAADRLKAEGDTALGKATASARAGVSV